MSDEARMIAEAVLFAADAHAGQRRDDGRTPYFNHLAEVAALCARREPFDAVLVAAAYLHDTVEDTGVGPAILRERFGDAVADLVLDVTDPADLKGRARRERQVAHTAAGSDRVKLLKIADKTSNVAELVDAPAPGETRKGREKYLYWAERVVEFGRGVDPQLEAAFDHAASRLRAAIAAMDDDGQAGRRPARR